jgi:hypothetical protein
MVKPLRAGAMYILDALNATAPKPRPRVPARIAAGSALVPATYSTPAFHVRSMYLTDLASHKVRPSDNRFT